jgi:hypothetical protein
MPGNPDQHYRIASPHVAAMLESIKLVAAIEVPSRHQPRSLSDAQMRFARTRYDHLASWIGVAIADALVAGGHVVLSEDGGELTAMGAQCLSAFGANITPGPRSKRIFCKPCLDWSERRYHVAGHVGAEICRRCLELGWLTHQRDTRALRLTARGQAGLFECFAIDATAAAPFELSDKRLALS